MIKIKMPKKSNNKKTTEPGGAGVIAIDMSGKILLGKRSQTVKHPGERGLPGGTVEKGERFIDAALREFEEEAGYEGGYRVVDSITFTRAKDGKKFKLFVLMIPVLGPGTQPNDEMEKLVWSDFSSMLEREPKHWVLKKVIETGFINPSSIEYYVSLVGEPTSFV